MIYDVLDDGRLLHLAGPNPGTLYTRCGVDAGLMNRTQVEDDVCGTWCAACLMKDAAEPKLEP